MSPLTVFVADSCRTDACRAVLVSLQRIARRRCGRNVRIVFPPAASWWAEPALVKEEAVVLVLGSQRQAAERLLTFWDAAARTAHRRRPALPIVVSQGIPPSGSARLLPAVTIRECDVYLEHGGIVSLDTAADAALAEAVDALLAEDSPAVLAARAVTEASK